MRRTLRYLTRHQLGALAGTAVVLGVLGGVAAIRLQATPIAVPFPLPVYQIEATSGGCTASIANLGIGYVGALQVPTPVDVNCDLLPDVLVAVNLIDIEGPLHDPLATDSTSYEDFLRDRVGRTIAPNIEISRFPLDSLAIILDKPSPPVRINVKLTVKDLEFQKPDTILRFGYDTGEGGSIPTHFKALVRGLGDFFNPLEAVVDTKGGLQGGDTVPTYYEGPLTLVGGVSTSDGKLDGKLDIAYSPFPDVVKVAYASDAAGQHVDYAHGVGEQILLKYGTALQDGTFENYVPGVLPEVDMTTKLDVLQDGKRLNLTADLDRLPRRLGLDIGSAADQARLDYEASNDGRLPDARIDLRSVAGGELTRAQAHIEEVPPELHAQWKLGNDSDISALFTTTNPDAPGFSLENLGAGPGIGAVEVAYANVDTFTKLTPFVASEQQFLSLQAVGGEQLLTGRLERIRGVRFATRTDGIDLVSRAGDGAQPLQANVQMDKLPVTGDRLDATARIAPLPDQIDVNLFSGDKTVADKPFKVVYASSQTVDVDAHAELRKASAATAACGSPGTTCADVGVRHLPARMEVAVLESGQVGPGSTTTVSVDSVLRPGAPKPDVHLDAVLGKQDSANGDPAIAASGPVLLQARGVLRGVPETVRLRFVEGADETLERLDVATCELNAAQTCAAGTKPLERLDVVVRNFTEAERADAKVPPPSSVAPQFVTLSARGLDRPGKTADPVVRFEASARVRDIKEVRYANVNGLFGVRSAVGDSRDLDVQLDVQNVLFSGNDPTTGPVDLRARALVRPLPSDINLCLRESGFPLALADAAVFTDRCEGPDPFGDGSVGKTPLTFSYKANTSFDVDATVDFKARGTSIATADDHDIHGLLKLRNLPGELTAHIQSPPEKVPGAPPSTAPERLRVRTVAPGATTTNVDLEFEDRKAGASCADAQPAGDVTCATATVTKLPSFASLLVDTGPGEDTRAKVSACDLDVGSGACRSGTSGLIEEVTARLRMVKGNPVEEGELVPFVLDEHPYAKTAVDELPYVLALRLDQDDDDNKELRAEGRLAKFRSLSFERTDEGFAIKTDLGDNVTPLLASVGLDTRLPASAPPPPPPPPGQEPKKHLLVLADTRVEPLPQTITISQQSPGLNQLVKPLDVSYTSSAAVNVDARAQIFGQVAGPLCGDHGSLCATLHLERLPSTISAKVGTYDEAIPATPRLDDARRRLFVDLDATPFGGVAAPNLVLDAALGTKPEGAPPYDDTPIVAHGELRGFSEKARIRLAQTGTLMVNGELKDSAFEEAVFATCALVAGTGPASCGGNPEFPVREIAIAARNFHVRPTDFAVPRRTDVPDRNPGAPASSDPMYAEVVGRRKQFEASAGFTSVRQFRMVNVNSVLGVKVAGGDGQPLTAHADLVGLQLPSRDLGKTAADGVEERTLDIEANASLTNVPTEFAFCLRQSRTKIQPASSDFTAPCEDVHPFADSFFEAEDPPTTSPMSIAYRANAPITKATTDARAQVHRVRVKPLPFPLIEERTPQPTIHVVGDVTIDHLPEHLTAHIESPVDKDDKAVPVEVGSPLRALFFYDDSPSLGSGGPPVDITFKARYTQGDAVCKDLRDSQVAFCLAGKLENLPSRAKVYFDPNAPLSDPNKVGLVRNLKVDTSNTDPAQKLNLRNVKVSVVKDDDPAAKPLVLVAEGDILGLPKMIDGTIHMPDKDKAKFDKPAFDINADPPIDTVDLFVQNFVAPNPLPDVAPPRGGVVADQTVTFRQRGDFFRADAFIKNVAGGGYLTGRNTLGQATETHLLRVDFGVPLAGPKPVIRGYADLLTTNDAGDPTHIFADAVLRDMPHGLDICFRGKFPETPDHDLTAAPNTDVYCDRVPPKLGAFRFQGRVSGDPEPELDVDAFFRMTKDSDVDVLKAVATVRNIPNVIEGRFGDGQVSVSSFKADGTSPVAIDDVVVEMADFDFAPDGYGDEPPWGVRVPGTVPLPPVQPGPAHEHARVAFNGADFHVKAHLGTAFDGTDGARVTSFVMDPKPCDKPAGTDSYFPHYPTGSQYKYTCVRADLEARSAHPLLIDADLVLDGTPITVRDAGLSEVPRWFQATIAKSPTMGPQGAVPDAFLRRCRTAIVEAAVPNPAPCMPPLLHFDSEGAAKLFGRLWLGNTADLADLNDEGPLRNMVDLEASPVPPSVRPGAEPWPEYPGGKGVRLKLGDFPKLDGVPGSEDRKAVRASFRLDVPRALTVDQVQKWSFDDKSSDLNYRSASDIRFHYVLRDAPASGSEPTIVTTAGELAAMIHDFKSGGQVLVSKHTPDLNLLMPDPPGGIPIPGEFGLDFYDRDYKGEGRRLVQADVRSSSDLAARVRLVAGKDAKIGDSDFTLADVRAVPTGDASYTTDPEKPSFRLRAEIKDPKDQVNPPGGGGGGGSDLLCLVWCLKTDVGTPKLRADLDLHVAGPPVRMIEAVLNTRDDKLGAELRSYANIEGTTPAKLAADSSSPGAFPLAATGLGRGGLHVDIDPFTFFVHAGIPVIAGFDLLLTGEMNVDVDIAPTDRFVLRNNKTVIQAGSSGAGPSVVDGLSDSWIQVAEAPGVLAGYVGLFWPFPPIYFFYGIGAAPVVPFSFYACPTPLHVNPVLPFNLPILPGDGLKATAFLPFRGPVPDPRFPFIKTVGGTPPFVKPLLDGLIGLAGPPILCGVFDTDNIALHSGQVPSHNGDRSPGDPLVLAGHPVAGLGVAAPPGNAPPPPGVTLTNPDLVASAGQTLSLCGTHGFNNITLPSGTTVNVATVAGDDAATPFVDCPPNQPDNPNTPEDETLVNVGRLDLAADGTLTLAGTANGPTGGTLHLTADTFTVEPSGRINVGTGLVELFAGGFTMGGLIVGDGVATTMPQRSDNGTAWAGDSTGNAGASHGGAGGAGTGPAGAAGGTYGSGVVADLTPGTETGTRGASPATTGGRGGAAVTLRGSRVTISGTIRMNGTVGGSTGAGQCSVEDNPNTPGNEASANTGGAGAGGGSGGGVAIHGVTLNVTGTIEARGGTGGSGRGGAGGGGGGGVVRLNAGDVDPDGDALKNRVHIDGGGAGVSLCGDDFDNGAEGGAGRRDVTETPQSHALRSDRFWYRPADLTVPYRAAAAVKPGILGFDNDDFTVYLCGVRKGPEAVEAGGGFGLEMPGGDQPNTSNPCGTKRADQPPEASPVVVATTTHSNTEVAPDDAVLDPTDGSLTAGVWGLWTVSSKPVSFLATTCFPFYPFYDNCLFETNPTSPEVTVGVDPAPPSFGVAPAGTSTSATGEAVTRSRDVTLTLASAIDVLPRTGGGTIAVSGIAGYRCFVDHAGTLTERTNSCTANDKEIKLDLGNVPTPEGRYDVYVVATDQAGNTTAPMAGDLPDRARFNDAVSDAFDAHRIKFVFDNTAPQSGTGAITVPPGPTGANGWYLNPPTQYRIDGYDDGANGSGPPATGGFLYRFDGAEWTSCPAPCTIPGPPPGAGSHRLSWKAIDAAGLEGTTKSIPVLIDPSPPKTAIATIPEFEANTWITATHPFAVTRAVDVFGGSGVGTSTSNLLCDNNPATDPGISGTCVSRNGLAGPWTPYSGMIELSSGEDQVLCAYSIDVAGNIENPTLAKNCTVPLDIDNLDPTGTISVVPPAPTGNAPWYDGDAAVPAVTLSGYNGTGSPQPAGGGFRYRVDNSTEFSCADPCLVNPTLLGAGSNVLHWTVVDTAGNRRPEQRVPLSIDRDDPRAHAMVEPPVSAGANGWYHASPTVSLAGFDEPKGSVTLRPRGSGVQQIRYRIDAGPLLTYSVPFKLAPGDHQLCILGDDVAGNEQDNGAFRCQRVAVDVADPTTTLLQNGSAIPANDGSNGWYRLLPVSITQTSTDGAVPPASGLVPQSLSPALCDHVPETVLAPAGVCISVDGRAPGAGINGPEFGPYTGAVQLGEGEHVIRAFSVDRSGRRSAMDHDVLRVDRSDPVSVARLRAPQASAVGLLRPWWRHQPTLVLRAIDGVQNSGVAKVQYRINGGGTIFDYAAPVQMQVGVQFIEHRAVDRAGRTGPWRRIDVAVDLKPPFVKALAPAPNPLWLHINLLGIIKLGPDKAKLNWQISEETMPGEVNGRVRVRVLVFSAAGLVVRHLDGGVQNVTRGAPLSGFTYWDGTDDSLLGLLPAGVYYYRVVAVDDAGNVAMSGESSRLQVKVKLVLLA